MAQVVHAVGAAVSGPVPEATNAVVLAVPDERALTALHQRLVDAKLPAMLVHEPDAPWNGQATAIGLPPVTAGLRQRLRRHEFACLPLYGRCAATKGGAAAG